MQYEKHMYDHPTQNQNSKQDSAMKRFIVIAICGVSLVSVGAYVVVRTRKPTATRPTETVSQDVIPAKQPTPTPTPNSSAPASSPTPKPVESTNSTSNEIPVNPSITIAITNLAQQNGVIHASAAANYDGLCVFLFRPDDGGRPVVKEVTTTSKECTADISELDFAYIGKWTLELTIYKDNQKAETNGEITIN